MDNANEAAAAKPGPFIPMDKKDIIRAAVYGAFAGAILTVLYILVSRVASAAMCRGNNDLCQNAPLYVAIFSVTLVSIGGLILLSQARIYRPLFIVLASVAALWGLQAYLALLPWYWAMAAMTVIGALTYAMFTWLARLRSFILYLVVSIVLIVAARLIIAG